jgi:hypothetical protein
VDKLGLEWAGVSVSEHTMLPNEVGAKIVHVLAAVGSITSEREKQLLSKLHRLAVATDRLHGAAQLRARDALSYLVWEDLFDQMNSIAPEGYYFGAHEGNGSDYGFWRTQFDAEDNELFGDGERQQPLCDAESDEHWYAEEEDAFWRLNNRS